MNLNLEAPVLALEAGQILTLDDAVGLSILARSGTVWVTEEGSPSDHIVGPGDTLIVARPGRTLVQAMHPAWISLAEGAGAWYAGGLRWIGTLFQGASAAPQPLEPHPELLPPDYRVFQLRHRIQSLYF